MVGLLIFIGGGGWGGRESWALYPFPLFTPMILTVKIENGVMGVIVRRNVQWMVLEN